MTGPSYAATSIKLDWTDNSNNEDGFKVERSPDGSTGWTQIGISPANTPSYTDSGLSDGTIYYYRVRAYVGSSNSSYTSVVNATTAIGALPPPWQNMDIGRVGAYGATTATLASSSVQARMSIALKGQ